MGEEKEEPLMSLRPTDPFQLLLWERNRSKEQAEEIRRLNLELGMIKSELDEIKAELKTTNQGQLINKCRKQKDLIDELRKNLRREKANNELLMGKLAISNYQAKYDKS